jgi:hypothetical protein
MTQLEKLSFSLLTPDGDNYLIWALDVKLHLQARNLVNTTTDVIQVTADKVAPASSQVLAPISNIRASLITQRSMSSKNIIN